MKARRKHRRRTKRNPARSEKQRRLFSVARSIQKRKRRRKRSSKAARRIARTVKPATVEKFMRRAKTRTRIVYRTRKIKVRSKPECNYYGLRTGSGTKLYRITGSRMTTVGTFRRKGLTNYCRKHGIKC